MNMKEVPQAKARSKNAAQTRLSSTKLDDTSIVVATCLRSFFAVLQKKSRCPAEQRLKGSQ
jgi:hypothetical protein